MCEVANLPWDCTGNALARKLIRDEIMMNVHLTNAVFVFSKIKAYVQVDYIGGQHETDLRIKRHMKLLRRTAPKDYFDYFCVRSKCICEYVAYTHGDWPQYYNGWNGGSQFWFSRNSKHQYVFAHEFGHQSPFADLSDTGDDVACETRISPCFKTIMN